MLKSTPQFPSRPFTSGPRLKEDGLPCCTAPQFSLTAYETGSWRNPTDITIQYDKINSLMRVDTDSGNGNTAKDGFFTMWMNFTSGIEWYFNQRTGECVAYGLDYWNDWCYGPQENTLYAGTFNIAGTKCDFWAIDTTEPILFSNTQYSCIPVTKSRQGGSEFTIYYQYTPTVNAAYFIPNPACHRAQVIGPAPEEHLDMARAPGTLRKKRL